MPWLPPTTASPHTSQATEGQKSSHEKAPLHVVAMGLLLFHQGKCGLKRVAFFDARDGQLLH